MGGVIDNYASGWFPTKAVGIQMGVVKSEARGQGIKGSV